MIKLIKSKSYDTISNAGHACIIIRMTSANDSPLAAGTVRTLKYGRMIAGTLNAQSMPAHYPRYIAVNKDSCYFK